MTMMADQPPAVREFYDIWLNHLAEYHKKKSLWESISSRNTPADIQRLDRLTSKEYKKFRAATDTRIREWFEGLSNENQYVIVRAALNNENILSLTEDYWTDDQQTYFTLVK